MTLFTNPNFIDHIVRSQGTEDVINPSCYPTLQTLIQIQTRGVIETAIKFMRNARRDVLQVEDIQLAVKDMLHFEITSSLGESSLSKSGCLVKDGKRVISPQELLNQQLQLLDNYKPLKPRVTGTWIYINGKIPSTNENIHLQSLSQLVDNGQKQERKHRQLFNVIKDDPYSLLTKQQFDYFLKITNIIAANPHPAPNFNIDGDLNNLLPFFLKYLGQAQLNETGIAFLLQLLCNKLIWAGVQYNLKKVLNLLLVYRGTRSYEVGVKIAELVSRFEDKYPVLRDIFVNYPDESYSTFIKKIAFEVYLGIPMEMEETMLSKCKKDAQSSDSMAELCLRTLLQHSSEIGFLKNYVGANMDTLMYWQPSCNLKPDPYLLMF